MSFWYLDTSAILKLIFKEKESKALQKFISDQNVSSDFARLEIARNIKGGSTAIEKNAQLALSGISFIKIDADVVARAQLIIEGSELRAPDAIHVATALQMGSLIEGVITYDRQMAAVSTKLEIRVEAPE